MIYDQENNDQETVPYQNAEDVKQLLNKQYNFMFLPKLFNRLK